MKLRRPAHCDEGSPGGQGSEGSASPVNDERVDEQVVAPERDNEQRRSVRIDEVEKARRVSSRPRPSHRSRRGTHLTQPLA